MNSTDCVLGDGRVKPAHDGQRPNALAPHRPQRTGTGQGSAAAGLTGGVACVPGGFLFGGALFGTSGVFGVTGRLIDLLGLQRGDPRGFLGGLPSSFGGTGGFPLICAGFPRGGGGGLGGLAFDHGGIIGARPCAESLKHGLLRIRREGQSVLKRGVLRCFHAIGLPARAERA